MIYPADRAIPVTVRPIRTPNCDTYICKRCGIEPKKASRSRTGYCVDCYPIVKKERWI